MDKLIPTDQLQAVAVNVCEKDRSVYCSFGALTKSVEGKHKFCNDKEERNVWQYQKLFNVVGDKSDDFESSSTIAQE